MHSLELINKRTYLSSDVDAQEWRNLYLGDHVQEIQEKKQNHVHILNAKGERVPLSHCKRADNPKKCKGDFPRTLWVIDQAVVLCQGLMKRMEMTCGGLRNRLGSLHGRRNDDDLNGSHPVLMAFTQTNSDVQVPYRFGITEDIALYAWSHAKKIILCGA